MNWFTRLFARATTATLFSLTLITLFPLVALAQDASSGGFSLFGLDAATLALYGVAVLAFIEFAKRVAAIVPGKKDDEIVGVIDGVVRKLVDLIAGKTGRSDDPSLVKRDPPSDR